MKNQPERSTGKGRLFILSAPSGAGKTTLRQALLERRPQLRYSVSFTTRPPRPEEVEGRDYVFLNRDAFEQGIASGRWAEWARVHGNYYGTSAEVLEQALSAGEEVLLDIDVQGARQILDRFPQAVSIFIMPPSLEVLEQRLRFRGTESPEGLALRLQNARREMDQRRFYRHVMVNDELDAAIEELVAIVDSYRGSGQ